MAATFALTTGVVYVRSWSGTVSGGSLTLTGVAQFANGSAAAPSITFSGDTGQNSGFYLVGADNVGAAAGGALIWDWNASRLKLASGVTLDWNTTVIDATDIAKIDGITNGTGAAAKALVLDANADITAGLRAITQTYSGIAATSTDGLVIQNATASTAGVPVQQSPRLRFRSNVWNTTVTAANNTNDWIIEGVPVSGTTPSGLLKFGSSLNGGAYTFPATLSSAGVLTTLSTVASGGNVTGSNYLGTGSVRAGDGQDFYWSTRSAFHSTADGIVTVSNNGSTGFTAFGRGLAGSATSIYSIQKKVTAIADNSATTVFTVTVPNANHAASIKLRFLSSNGSTDAFESSRTAEGTVVLARTTGVATVATAVAISDEAIATVAAGATHTLAYSITAMSGAADATQTFAIQVTIDDSGNLGANQVVATAELLNAEASGVTIA